jgi:hypothetical protein
VCVRQPKKGQISQGLKIAVARGNKGLRQGINASMHCFEEEEEETHQWQRQVQVHVKTMEFRAQTEQLGRFQGSCCKFGIAVTHYSNPL